MTDVTTAPPPWSPVAAQSAPAQAVASQSGSSLSFLSGSRAPAGFGTRPEEMDEARRFSAALERAGNEPVQPVPAVSRLPLHTEQTAFSFGKPEEMDRAVPPDSFEEDASASAENDFFGEDGLTFSDFIDIINPLQHIPGVSTLYRSLTGDEISPGARMAGGTLYGGPIGFASALANTVVEETTGSDIAGNVMAALTGSDAPGDIGDPIGDPIGGTQTAALSAADVPTAQAQTVPIQPEEILALENIAPAGGTSPLFAAQPQGNGPIFAAQPTRQSPLADPNATANLAQAQIQAQQPPAPTVPSTANTLSPQVHDALMQMAQESELQAQAQLQSQIQPQVQTQITAPPAAPAVVPPLPSPPTPPPTQPVADSAAASSGGYIDPIAPQDLPNAMMEALARYEALSQ